MHLLTLQSCWKISLSAVTQAEVKASGKGVATQGK